MPLILPHAIEPPAIIRPARPKMLLARPAIMLRKQVAFGPGMVAPVFGVAAIGGGGGGWTFIAGISGAATDGNSGAQTTGSINTTGADFIVVGGAYWNGGGTGVITDSKGNTYSNLLTERGSVPATRIYWIRNPIVGSGHTFTISGSFVALSVMAFSGSHATPFDAEAGSNGTSATASAGAGVTPSVANELVVAFASVEPAPVPNSVNGGFTLVDTEVGGFGDGYSTGCAYLIQGAAAVADPDWTLSASSAWSAAIACFKAA